MGMFAIPQYVPVRGDLPVPWISDKAKTVVGAEPHTSDSFNQLVGGEMIGIINGAKLSNANAFQELIGQFMSGFHSVSPQDAFDTRATGFVNMDKNKTRVFCDNHTIPIGTLKIFRNQVVQLAVHRKRSTGEMQLPSLE